MNPQVFPGGWYIDATLSTYGEEHEDRVAQAIKARAAVKRPGGRAPRPKAA